MSKKRPKTESQLTTAAEVLQGLFDKGNGALAQDFKRYRLRLDWPKVVGVNLAAHTVPVGFLKGTLYVWVSSSTWMNQLFYMRKQLAESVNRHMNESWVRDIRFTQNRNEVPAEAAAALPPAAPNESKI